jgi:hypothetical protein
MLQLVEHLREQVPVCPPLTQSEVDLVACAFLNACLVCCLVVV